MIKYIGLIVIALAIGIGLIIRILQLVTKPELRWQLPRKYFLLKMVVLIAILIMCFIAVIFALNRLNNTQEDTSETVEQVQYTVEETTVEVEETTVVEELESEELIKNQLLSELQLLRKNDTETLLRWFSGSIDLKGISNYIPDILLGDMTEDGYYTILVYDELLKSELNNTLINEIKADNIGMSETEVEVLVEQRLREYDKSNFYRRHTLNLDMQNGLIVITEELKNIITNGEYMSRVINYENGTTSKEAVKDKSFTEDVMNRGVN